MNLRLDLLRGPNGNGDTFRIDVVHGFESSQTRSFLVETEITARAKSFAVSFKEAVENADVIFYAGHSGLGGNLDIPSLEEKAGGPILSDSRWRDLD
jgi:hypothetical protein